jgi:4-amino-4-deoxy-L-arabinose transferase-like glycosyltransferase
MRRRAQLVPGVALGLVVLLGVTLRVLGIAFGLPYHHHWDEGWIADSAAGMLRRHDGVPASYQYGAPLMRLTELAFVLLQWARHAPLDVTPLDAKTTLYVAGRLTTALVASSGIPAVAMASWFARGGQGLRRGGGPSTTLASLASALLYAVSSELVLHSRYSVTDACLVALTAWTLAFASAYLAGGRVVWGALSVLAAGVTFGFKMPGMVTLAIPLLAALLLYVRARREGKPRRAHAIVLVAAVPAALAMYVALNPHLVDHTDRAVHDLVTRYRQTHDGGFSSVYLRRPGLPHLLSAVWAIVTEFLGGTMLVSVMLSAVSLWGLVRDLRRRNAVAIVAAAYAVCLVLSVALPNRTFLYRNYLVVIPSLCLGFGSGVVASIDAVRDRLAGRPALRVLALSVLGAAGVIALVGLPLVEAIEAQRHQGDPRVAAVDWIARQVQGGSPPIAPPVEVATTSSVFGKAVLDGYPELRGVLQRSGLHFAATPSDVCPPETGGADYVIDASYRDTGKAPADDPWQGQWFFQQCPGYDLVAAFDASPYEVNLRAYPTWYGRVSALVLRRR